MRDPKRIPRLIEKLGYVWIQNPDIRLCQLVTNLGSNHGMVATALDSRLVVDVFHVEDDLIEAELDRRLAEGEDR